MNDENSWGSDMDASLYVNGGGDHQEFDKRGVVPITGCGAEYSRRKRKFRQECLERKEKQLMEGVKSSLLYVGVGLLVLVGLILIIIYVSHTIQRVAFIEYREGRAYVGRM